MVAGFIFFAKVNSYMYWCIACGQHLLNSMSNKCHKVSIRHQDSDSKKNILHCNSNMVHSRGGDFISHNLNRASNKIICNKNNISGKMKLLLHTVNVRDCESLGTSDLVQVRGPSRRWKISESPGDWIVPLGCPVRPGNKAVQVELGEGSPWLITTMKKRRNQNYYIKQDAYLSNCCPGLTSFFLQL